MAPFRKITRKELKLSQKPWITPDILAKCSKRDAILKEISKELDPGKIQTLQVSYKTLRNQITREKRAGKKAYYLTYFEKNKKKSSEIWKGIRSLVNVSKTKTNQIKLLDKNEIISDSDKVANISNHHFATVGHKVQQKIPSEKRSFKDYFKKGTRKVDYKLIKLECHSF